MTETKPAEFEGIYGKYIITNDDKMEVSKYRLAVLCCAISYSIGLIHWIIIGPNTAWIWLAPMSISLGLALQWIHIYIKVIHKALKFLWLLGSLSIFIFIFIFKSEEGLAQLVSNPIYTFVFGPFFAALTGLGFKEFFCFRRPEAIGTTLLVPIGLLLHLFGIFDQQFIMMILCISSILFLILAFRKLGMDPASDIGDKSIFEYLHRQEIS